MNKEQITPDEAGFLMLYADVEYHSSTNPKEKFISRRYYQGGITFYGLGQTPLDAAIDSQRQVDEQRQKEENEDE